MLTEAFPGNCPEPLNEAGLCEQVHDSTMAFIWLVRVCRLFGQLQVLEHMFALMVVVAVHL